MAHIKSCTGHAEAAYEAASVHNMFLTMFVMSILKVRLFDSKVAVGGVAGGGALHEASGTSRA